MTEAGWTSNVPANEGEYWFRSDGVRKPIVAHVYRDVEQDLRIIIGINDVYVTDLDGFDEFDGAEFLGPITPTDRQQGRVEGLVAMKDYLETRAEIVEGDALRELWAGNSVKENNERSALAEIRAMQSVIRDLEAQAAQDEKDGGIDEASSDERNPRGR